MTSTDTSTISVRPLEARAREDWAELFRGYRDFHRLPPDGAVVDRVRGRLRDDAVDLDAVAAVDGIALVRGASVVRWITAEDNSRARRLDDATGTEWVTYDLTPGALARGGQDGDRT